MDAEGGSAMERRIVIVYNQQEYEVVTVVNAASATSDAVSFSLELLQCQLLSLVGLVPDEQILVSSEWMLVAMPPSLQPAQLTLKKSDLRPRFFLFDATTADAAADLHDWQSICSKAMFGDVPVVQPAFRNANFLVCQACANTCSASPPMINPMEWNKLDAVNSRFISAVTVISGDVDVDPPAGFTRLPYDLNFSASGNYVYLCVKRGGDRAITQLDVLYQRTGLQESAVSDAWNKIGVNCNEGNCSNVGVQIAFGDISRVQEDLLKTIAITDIVVIADDESPPASYIKIAKNLNEGVPGSFIKRLYLCYRSSPLGGFVCESGPSHSAFGGCLFESRHAKDLVSVCSMNQQRLNASMLVAAARIRADESYMTAYFQQREPGMRSRLQGGLDRARSYENKHMQQEALRHIPVELLHQRARANASPMPAYQDELVMQLLHWFKREFFSWMNQPKCSICHNEKTQLVRSEGASTPEERAGQASRVEVYQCPACRGFTRFPRYNDPVKLLETRTGRCGEWANCFTLCCRAMGFEARYVLDVTDHVWTEVYSDHFKRWLHCDSCEDQLDCPLTYEVGWGKKLSYIFSFSHEEVVDTARRYTRNWEGMLSRRQDVSEKWLQTTIDTMNAQMWSMIPRERAEILQARRKVETDELKRGRTINSKEVQGRVSGSEDWKSQRQEDGKTAPSGSEASVIAGTTEQAKYLSITEVSQQLWKNLLMGCEKPACVNPYCLHARGKDSTSTNPTERAAASIELVTSLNAAGLSAEGLASLLCPTQPDDIRSYMLSQKPLMYLTLQDSSNSSADRLADCSGNENHVTNECRCALRKPFQVPDPSEQNRAYGIQLAPGQHLSVYTKTSPESFVLSFLMRLDLFSATSEVSGEKSILTIQVDADTSVSFLSTVREGKFTCDVKLGGKNVRSSLSPSVIAFGLYSHIVVARNSKEVTVFANAVEVARQDIISDLTEPVTTRICLIGPVIMDAGSMPVVCVAVSHVALLPLNAKNDVVSFCQHMKAHYIMAPPLAAYDSNGACKGKMCEDKIANVQSGYRVAKVLMWGQMFFDGIQFIYEGPSGDTVPGCLIGNARANQTVFSPATIAMLFPDEYITHVRGRKGAWTDSLEIGTNFGRVFSCGGSGGGPFEVKLPPNVEVRSISFNLGDHLVNAVVFVGEPLKLANEVTRIEEIISLFGSYDSTAKKNAVAAGIRYLENIASHPQELKFQRIRASNKYFASNVGNLNPAASVTFMKFCGFEHREEAGEIYFVFEVPSDVEPAARRRICDLKKISMD